MLWPGETRSPMLRLRVRHNTFVIILALAIPISTVWAGHGKHGFHGTKVSLPLARVRFRIFVAIRVRSLYFAPGAVVESAIRYSL